MKTIHDFEILNTAESMVIVLLHNIKITNN